MESGSEAITGWSFLRGKVLNSELFLQVEGYSDTLFSFFISLENDTF